MRLIYFIATICSTLACTHPREKEPEIKAHFFSKPHKIESILCEKFKKFSTPDLIYSLTSLNQYKGLFPIVFPEIIVFSPRKKRDIEEVQRSFYNICRNVVTTFNSIPEIRPYLRIFPATLTNINIRLAYGPYFGSFYSAPYFSVVYHRSDENYIVFKQLDQKNFSGSCFDAPGGITQEIEEVNALHILNTLPPMRMKGSKKTPLLLEDSFPNTSFFGRPSQEKRLFTESCKKQNLHLSSLYQDLDRNTIYPTDLCVLATFWTQEKKIELQEAREFMKVFLNDCKNEIQQKLDFEKKNTPKGELLEKVTVDMKNIGFKVSFWDDSIDRLKSPYIALICYGGGKITYYTSDEHQKLEKIFMEDALELATFT